ncbi:MAG: hypothetical protein LBL41_01820 [Bifidobacteriaceae bacterium]|jgi:hypothetical protein|nr:hypothetical protein [Bifidobacteriaceae bacterium]
MSSIVYILPILLIITANALYWLFLCFTKTGRSVIVIILFSLLFISALISLFAFTLRYPDWVIALTLGVVYGYIVREGGKAVITFRDKIQADIDAGIIRGTEAAVASNLGESDSEKGLHNSVVFERNT